MMKAILKRFYKQVIVRFPPLQLAAAFLFQIMLADYRVYAAVKRTHGLKCAVLGTAMRGTGDIYFCGMYLRAWLAKNGVADYVFLYGGYAEGEAARLFSVLRTRLFKVTSPFIVPSDRMRAFFGAEGPDMFWFHAPSQTHGICGIHSGNTCLQGYKGLHMLEWYMRYTMCLPYGAVPAAPEFSDPESAVLGQAKNAVLIAPYSKGNVGGQIPDMFWDAVVRALLLSGYDVFTNCAQNEKPLPNTGTLLLPYAQVVPFLNRAAGFIGIRSGLCDLISASSCKKVIIHTKRSHWWPDGYSLAYTGLNNMGLCRDAFEFEYSGTDDLTYILALFQGVRI